MMMKSDRFICVLASLVPAAFVWLATQRHARFQELMSNYLGSPRYEWVTPVSDFVFKTIHYWPWVVILGWTLLVPAMFGKTWSRKFRVALTCVFLVLGPLLYGLCLEGLNHSQMNVLEMWHRSFQQMRERREQIHQQTPGGDSSTRADAGFGTPQE
jgi:hypothetical protein